MMTSTMSLTLLLPPELFEHVLTFAHPKDVAQFGQTCRAYYELVFSSGQQYLWRALFFSDPDFFDDPYKCLTPIGLPYVSEGAEFDWRHELQRRVRTETVIANPDRCRLDELDDVLDTLLGMALNIPVASASYAYHEISRNLVWLAAQRQLDAFIDHWHPLSAQLPEPTSLRLAKLHTHFGLTAKDFDPERRVQSRARVYDMRYYTQETAWGPYILGSAEAEAVTRQVNWVHMCAVQHLMAMHVVSPRRAEECKMVSFLPYCQAQLIGKPTSASGHDDWAGVEGAWSCSFAFVDHRDLLDFNAQETPANEPRNGAMFDDPDFIEVFRTFTVHLLVTGNTPNPEYPSKPTIHFKGNIRDIHTMAGHVFIGCDNTIRWTFASGEDNQLIWSSLGIQIGAIQSTFGVLGTWTTVFHDEGDPVGPLWLRKKVDNEESEDWTFATN